MKKRKVDYELIQTEDPSLLSLPRPRLIMIPNHSINPPLNPSLDSATAAQLDHCLKDQRTLKVVEELAQRGSVITEQETSEAEEPKQIQELEEERCSTPKTPTAHEKLSVTNRADDHELGAAATVSSAITVINFRVSAPALICPPAPRKPKAKPKLISKQSPVGFFIPPDLDLFFSPPSAAAAAPAIAKTSAETSSSPSSTSSSSSSSSSSLSAIDPQSSTCPD